MAPFNLKMSIYNNERDHSPLSMTDGGARLIELNINTIKDPKHRAHIEKALKHFTTRDPKMFWTSGQWVSEYLIIPCLVSEVYLPMTCR